MSGRNDNRGNSRNYQDNKDFKKKSGCHMGTSPKNNARFISGWNVSKKGFIALVACPAHQFEHVTTKDGELRPLKQGWERWVCTIEFKPGDGYKTEKSTHTGFFKKVNSKLYIPDLKMVASPNSPNKGYFGRSFVPKK